MRSLNKIDRWILHFRRQVSPYAKTFKLGGVVLALALVVALVINVAQGVECLAAIAENIRSSRGWDTSWDQLLFLFLFTVLFGGMLWYWARTLQYAFLRTPAARGGWDSRAWVRANFPRAIGMIPFLGVAIAFLRGGSTGFGFLWILLGVGFFAFCVVRRRFLTDGATTRGLPATSRVILQSSGLFFFILMMVFVVDPQSARNVGAVAIVLSAGCAGAVFCGAMVFAEARYRFPFFWIFLGWVALCSALDWNDNHQLRHVVAANQAHASQGSKLEEVFNAWLRNRPDRSRYRDGYPVVLVASEGGGIYAAYHTAMLLTALQDRNPEFSHHLFVISGVSGGSLGATVFAALSARPEDVARCTASFPRLGRLQSAAKAYFARDLLAPMIATAAYPDLVQQALPFPLPSEDRVCSLERSFEAAWLDMQQTPASDGHNVLNEDFDDLFDHFETGSIPALMLNTTEVETGLQWVVSNLPQGRWGPKMFYDEHPSVHLRLSTATALSARFPFVASAGTERLENNPQTKRRYVDGGYYESSGMGSLATVVSEILHRTQDPANPPVKLIVLRIGLADPAEQLQQSNHGVGERSRSRSTSGHPGNYTQDAFGEVGSPIRGLLNSRNGRILDALAYVHSMVDQQPNSRRVEDFLLSIRDQPLPLGWLLSESDKTRIEAAVTDYGCRLVEIQRLLEPGDWPPLASASTQR